MRCVGNDVWTVASFSRCFSGSIDPNIALTNNKYQSLRPLTPKSSLHTPRNTNIVLHTALLAKKKNYRHELFFTTTNRIFLKRHENKRWFGQATNSTIRNADALSFVLWSTNSRRVPNGRMDEVFSFVSTFIEPAYLYSSFHGLYCFGVHCRTKNHQVVD